MSTARRPISSPELRRTVRSYARALVKAHALAAESQRHNDRMLMWLVGLTGAAMFALPSLVASICAGDRPKVIAGPAGAWTASIVLGLVARMVGVRYRDADDLLFLAKWGGLQEFIIGVGDDPDRLLDIVNDRGGIAPRKAAVRRYRRRFTGLYYGALAAAALGAVLLSWRLARC